jgi:hypothetical protein
MVRIWCVPVQELNRQHLLGEHLELHIIVTALQKKKGYFKHPQTQRFNTPTGLSELLCRHQEQVEEMQRRGYNHKSPLNLTISMRPYTYTRLEYERDHAELILRQKPKNSSIDKKVTPTI